MIVRQASSTRSDTLTALEREPGHEAPTAGRTPVERSAAAIAAVSQSMDPETLVREHAAYVWRTLRFLGVREADLDDASQEVFIVVLRRWSDFEGRSSVATWLRGICVRTAAAFRRRAHVRKEVLVDAHDDEHAGGSPESDLEARRGIEKLCRALDGLDDDKRAVFVLYEIEGLSMREVAEALGCPLQTAYSRHHAAREVVVGALGAGGAA